MKYFIGAICIALIFGACTKEINDNPTTTVNSRTIQQPKSYSLAEAMDSIAAQVHATVAYNSVTKNWEATFGSTMMEIELHPTDTTKVYMKGAFFGNRTIGVKIIDASNGDVEFWDDTFSSQLSTSTVASYVVDNNGDYDRIAPCDEHPSGQTCDECFEQEVHDFCDGILGCTAIALHPLWIFPLILGHCLACCT